MGRGIIQGEGKNSGEKGIEKASDCHRLELIGRRVTKK